MIKILASYTVNGETTVLARLSYTGSDPDWSELVVARGYQAATINPDSEAFAQWASGSYFPDTPAGVGRAKTRLLSNADEDLRNALGQVTAS